jgi:hypothetical protein
MSLSLILDYVSSGLTGHSLSWHNSRELQVGPNKTFKSKLWVISETSSETISVETVTNANDAAEISTKASRASEPAKQHAIRARRKVVIESNNESNDDNDHTDNESDTNGGNEENHYLLNNVLNRFRLEPPSKVQTVAETLKPPVVSNKENTVLTESLYHSANSAFENFNNNASNTNTNNNNNNNGNSRFYGTNVRGGAGKLDCSVESSYFMESTSGSISDFNSNQDQFNTSGSSTNTEYSLEFYNQASVNNNACYYNSYNQHLNEYGQQQQSSPYAQHHLDHASSHHQTHHHHHHHHHQVSKYLQMSDTASSDFNNNTLVESNNSSSKSPYLLCSLQSSSSSSFAVPNNAQQQHSEQQQQQQQFYHSISQPSYASAENLADYYKTQNAYANFPPNNNNNQQGYMYYQNEMVNNNHQHHHNHSLHHAEYLANASGHENGLENCYNLGEQQL